MTREDYIEELIGIPDDDTIDISKIVYGLYSGLQESIYEWSIYVMAGLVYDYIGSRLHMDGIYRQVLTYPKWFRNILGQYEGKVS